MKLPFFKSAIALSIATFSFSINAASFGTVTIDGENVANPTQEILSSEENLLVTIHGEKSALQAVNENVMVRGQNLQFTSDTSDTLSISNGGVVSIGGKETENISIKSNAGSGYGGIFISNRAEAPTLNLTAKNISIEAQNGGVGIWAQNNTQENPRPEQVTTVNIDADNTTINATTGIIAFSNSVIDISGNLTINAETAIDTRGHSLVNINGDGNGTVKITGDILFETPLENSGNIIDSSVKLNLTGTESSWTGNVASLYPTDNTNVQTNVTGLTLELNDGAQWNPTVIEDWDDTYGDQNTPLSGQAIALNNLVLNDGTINVLHGESQLVHVEKVSGTGGTVNLLASTEDGETIQAGSVSIDQAAENVSLQVNAAGITADDIKNPEAALKSLNDKVTADVAKTNAISEGDVMGAISQDVSANGEAGAVQITENTKLASMKGVNAAALVAWRDEVAYTNQRLEFLRDASHAYGAWAQVYGGESSYDDASVDLKSTTVQVGADASIGDWVVGGAFSYMKGDADMTNGSADTDAYTLALYTARQFDSGFYVNGMARYGRLSTDATAGNMTGSYDNNAFSVGGNVGYRFTFAQQAFVEPQFGLQYAYVTGDDYTATNGVKVEQDNFDALVASLGARVGFNFAQDAGKLFARASVNHDFLGEVDGTAANDKAMQSMYVDLGGTWVTYGVGAQFNFTDNLSVWGNVDRSTGGEVSTHYMMNAGLRYTF